MNGLGSTDSGEVAVALIGENDILGLCALDACCNSRGASVGSLDHITAEIIICHNGASDGRDADGLALYTKLVNALRNKAVDYTVSAAGAIMGRHIKKRLGSLEYDCHYFSPPASFLIFSRTSAGVGIIPPVRPKNSTGLLQSIASLTSSII